MVSKEHRVSFCCDENVLKLTALIITHICQYTKKIYIVHFKWVNYTVCELKLNKAFKNNNRGRYREMNELNWDIQEEDTIIQSIILARTKKSFIALEISIRTLVHFNLGY